MIYLLALAITLLILGAVFLWRSRVQRALTGLPTGRIVYSDTGMWETVDAPLKSRRHGLVGKPDYLVQVQVDGRRQTVPIEVKSASILGRDGQPRRPYDSHVLQLATYCILVEEHVKQRPAYGLIHYADATLEVSFTDELRQQVLSIADQIRRARRASTVPRSHEQAPRCRNCGYRQSCGDEALGQEMASTEDKRF